MDCTPVGTSCFVAMKKRTNTPSSAAVRVPGPDTPGGKLRALMVERNMGQEALGRRLREEGRASGSQLVKKWRMNRGFTTFNQMLVARIFDISPTYFAVDDLRAGKPSKGRAALDSFLRNKDLWPAGIEPNAQEREYLEVVLMAIPKEAEADHLFFAQQLAAYRLIASKLPRKPAGK